MSEQAHHSDPRILNRRTLEHDHRSLARRLRPGMSVLDVGCGPGAITAGMAGMVGPHGYVLGVDRDEAGLALARQDHVGLQNLSFQLGDVLSLDFESQFDIVTAARTLQWTSDPSLALSQMKKAAKPGGRILVLDYNHENNAWEPEPPAAFCRFYSAFLEWRAANHWNNRMAECLPDLFREVGLYNIEVHVDDEITTRGEPNFATASSIWSHVIEVVGDRIVAAGYLSDAERLSAQALYPEWVRSTLERQTLELRTVEGVA